MVYCKGMVKLPKHHLLRISSRFVCNSKFDEKQGISITESIIL
jgi:hypothetical protein